MTGSNPFEEAARYRRAQTTFTNSDATAIAASTYFLTCGGLIIICAPALPGYISHGSLPDLVVSPVDSGVAYGV